MALFPFLAAWGAALALASASAPGAPGKPGTWTNGNKQGIGTSNSLASKVWFTLGEGAVQEVYYPTVDKADTRLLELLVTDGKTFLERESKDTLHRVAADPSALIFTQVNTSRSGRYRIRKLTVTDPERDAVLIRVAFEALKPGPYRLYAFYDPSLDNSAMHDSGSCVDGALLASDGAVASALVSSPAFSRVTSGFAGVSDGMRELATRFRLETTYARAPNGNVVQLGELPPTAARKPFTLVLAFGPDQRRALAVARAAAGKGFAKARRDYVRGWADWLKTLRKLEPPYRDPARLAAMLLKAHEDKTWRGASVASLSIPWGDGADADEPSVGGYHLVWARDLYHVATALHALGDKDAAGRALDYLFRVQQKPDGSFPQNSWLDGRPFWGGLQMDEVAYPLILAWQMGRGDAETYARHIRPAADFLAAKGPWTPQERWEENAGYSPSTIAAEIAALVCASGLARLAGDPASARRWLAKADDWNARLEGWTTTAAGGLDAAPLAHYIRLSQHGSPEKGEALKLSNGAGVFDEREIVDAGFLELVRLGLRCPQDPVVARSVALLDRTLRVDTPAGPGFYRYNHDGYGEHPDGRGYDGTGIGRLWPLLTGERGEYELARGGDGRAWLDALGRLANEGGVLPEQVWDRSDSPDARLRFGQGTGSATPLAWSEAQYIRLAVAIEDGSLPDRPAPVLRRYCREKGR